MSLESLRMRVFVVAPPPLGDECAAMLQAHGFEHFVYSNWPESLEAASARTPDLIVAAAPLRDEDFDALRALRALQPGAHLPILLLALPDWSEAHWPELLSCAMECVTLPLRCADFIPRASSLLRARRRLLEGQAALQRLCVEEYEAISERNATAARLEALVTQLQSGILVVDQHRRVVMANPQFCRVFGIEADPYSLVGLESWRLAAMTAPLLAESTKFWARVETIVSHHEIVSGEDVLLGDGRTLSRDYAPIFCGGRNMGHVWSYRDISERKNFEIESLRKRDSALQSAKFQSEFLANMSHEIRTPINGVLGMLGLLADTPLQADQRGLLATAQTSADALLHIINDILDFSKVKAGKLHIEDGIYTPIAVLDDCLQTVIATAHDKGLELLSTVDADVPQGARGDGARVRQVLTNLLSNAIKFTHRGDIEVRIQTQTQNGAPARFLRYSVCDSGIGIGEDARQNLFQPFTQADGSTTRRYGGTGLGLAICKQLVERMGGQIGVESRAGQGSTFWFTLPLVPVEIAEQSRKRDMVIALCDARVLVVEDNATIRRFLLQQLSSWHITGEGARTGSEALHRLRSAARAGRPYDAALLDAQLPDTDAFTLAHEIKSDDALGRTDLLLMTALHAALNNKVPFSATLSKPVRQSQLHDCLFQLFGGETPAPSGAGAAPAREERNFGGARVLLADDNAINREVALRWLQKWNCRITPVTNGREAVEALQKNEFDLVFMDCQMPEMDGYEASHAIRALRGAGRTVPIVAVTAHAMEGDREKCLAAGMSDYLSKPVRPDNLAQMLERWTEQSPGAFARRETPVAAAPAQPCEKPAPASVLDTQTLDELREAVGEDEYPQFIEMFFEQSSECERMLREAAGQNDGEALARVAHSLKGISRQYGAREVACACEHLEDHAKNGADFEAPIEALRAVLMSARIALHRSTTAPQTHTETRAS